MLADEILAQKIYKKTEAVDSHGSPSLMRRDLDTAGKGEKPETKQNHHVVIIERRGYLRS